MNVVSKDFGLEKVQGRGEIVFQLHIELFLCLLQSFSTRMARVTGVFRLPVLKPHLLIFYRVSVGWSQFPGSWINHFVHLVSAVVRNTNQNVGHLKSDVHHQQLFI